MHKTSRGGGPNGGSNRYQPVALSTEWRSNRSPVCIRPPNILMLISDRFHAELFRPDLLIRYTRACSISPVNSILIFSANYFLF